MHAGKQSSTCLKSVYSCACSFVWCMLFHTTKLVFAVQLTPLHCWFIVACSLGDPSFNLAQFIQETALPLLLKAYGLARGPAPQPGSMPAAEPKGGASSKRKGGATWEANHDPCYDFTQDQEGSDDHELSPDKLSARDTSSKDSGTAAAAAAE